MSTPSSSRARRRDRQPRPAVDLRVDTLALHGVAPSAAAMLTGSLRTELMRLAGSAVAFSSTQAPQIRAGCLIPGPPEDAGRAIAAALWTSIRQQGSPQ